MPEGGMYDATITNGNPEFDAQSNDFVGTPASPQLSQARSIPGCADASDADRATQQLAITKIFFIFAASKDATPASKRGRSPWVIQKHLGSAITTFPLGFNRALLLRPVPGLVRSLNQWQ